MDWLGDLLEDVHPATHELIRQLAAADIPVPEVGLELVGDDGNVLGGMLECAWPDQLVAVVLQDGLTPEEREVAFSEGWQLLEAGGSTQEQLVAARARLESTHIPRVTSASAVNCRLASGRLYLPALDGPDLTRWERISRALGEDGRSIPDRFVGTMLGVERADGVEDELHEDLLAMGTAISLPAVKAPAVRVRCTGTLAARDSYRFALDVGLSTPKTQKAALQDGAVWSSGKSLYLLPPALRRALDALAEGPPDGSTDDRMLWWGRLRPLLMSHGADIERYLLGSDAVVVSRLQVRLAEGEAGPELLVEADGVPADVLTSVADRIQPHGTRAPSHLGRDESGAAIRTKLLLDESARQGLVRVRQLRSRAAKARRAGVPWSDLPQLLDAPDTLLPTDVFDLSAFGDRVVGFGPVVYRVSRSTAQPDGGGFVLSPVDGQSDPPEWTAAEQRELGERLVRAAKRGQAYVRFHDAWVRVPPGTVAAEVKANADVRATSVVEERALVPSLNLDEQTYSPDDAGVGELPSHLEPPPGLAPDVTLFEHQEVGVRWLAGHAGVSAGSSNHGMLADDMGLGKTLQVLATLAYHRARGGGAALIVAPVSLLHNWRAEAERFFPDVFSRIEVIRGGAALRPAWLETRHIVLVSYDTLRRAQLVLGRIEWEVMVLDESHQIRNPTAKTTHAILSMNAKVRLALTGTPVQNAVEDLWSQFDWLAPGLLGDLSTFRKTYQDADADALEPLRRLVSPRILRRMKEDVLADRLPPKHIHRIALPMSSGQEALYEQIIEDQRRSGKRGSFGTMHRLFQLCSEPTLLSEDADEGPKLAWLDEQLDAIHAAGERVIIFAEWYALQDLLADRIERRYRVRVDRVNGKVEAGLRLSIVQHFNRTTGFAALLLGPKAAGVGLNITGANHVVHFSRHWNPALEQQATDRAYRIGQTRPVHVYLPIVSHSERPSIEEHLDALLESKRTLAREVLAPAHAYSVKSDLQRLVMKGEI